MTAEKALPWHMEMCLDADQELIERDFASEDEWEAWLRREHPRILGGFSSQADPWIKQYGTDYYWSQLTYSPASTTDGERQ